MTSPIVDAERMYQDQRSDGYIAIPTAAIGFQWFTSQLYLSQLPFASLLGCVVMSTSAFDRLPANLRDVVTAAAVKMGMRFSETTELQDDELLGGLFARQGVKSTPVSPALRAEFLQAAQAARERLSGSVVPAELLMRVQSWLADYRNEHR